MTREHEEKYRQMAREKHITLRGERALRIFGLRNKAHLRRLIAEDENLNNIPLRIFDNLTNTFNSFHPEQRMTLAEGTSLYKQLLRDYAAGKGQFRKESAFPELEREMRFGNRRPEVRVAPHVRRRSIVDRFGHRIRVKEWPSERGMATLRRHYKRAHPRAFRKSIEKGVRTRRQRQSGKG